MKLMLELFLNPYLVLLRRAAWNIQQNLVAASSWSTGAIQLDGHRAVVQAAWNPAASMMPLFGALIVLVLCCAPFFILTGYVLGRKRGAIIAVAVLLLPGMLDMVGLWPRISPDPAGFDIGNAGIIGDVLGAIPLIVLAVLAGWCVAILLVDCFRVRRRSWDIFDHFWLVFGLVAVIFFVFDGNAAQHDREHSETKQGIQRASAYLLKQVDGYDQWCHETSRNDLISCHWAAGVHQTLLDASFNSSSLTWDSEPNSSARLYGWYGQTASPEQAAAIRNEIGKYNQMICPVVGSSDSNWEWVVPTRHCEQTPGVLILGLPEPLNGREVEYLCERGVALDSECLIPTLVNLHRIDVAQDSRSEEEHRNRNYRWMYYLAFSFVLGAKLAGSTVKITALDERTGDEACRSIHVARQIALKASLTFRNLCGNLATLLKRIRARWRDE